MAEIVYTRHARRQMGNRHISEDEVNAVLESYHTSYTDRKGNTILIGHPGGRRVKVVVARGSDPAVVITVAD